MPVEKAATRSAKFAAIKTSVMWIWECNKGHPHDPQRTPGKCM
jgi:hypothetical protein